jgi:hypothetical protein
MPSMPSLPSLGEVPTTVWVVMAVVALPFLIVFGALGVKLLWGFWPMPTTIAAGGYGIYRLGIDWFWLIALGIAGGIVLTWLWQRTPLFLRGDRVLEKGLFLGD